MAGDTGGGADVGSTAPPRRLWWMYLLVLFALAGLGAGTGQAVFVVRDWGHAAAVQSCLSRNGINITSESLYSRTEAPPQFFACSASSDHREAVALLLGALVVPLVAWLLMIGGSLQMRLSRRGNTVASIAAARDAAERFEAWCDAMGLSGRHRPRLVLTAPGTAGGQAFTTGMPLARPVITVPIGYAYGEQSDFDVVVLHELAHVQARDLTWASAVWWAGWLSVPALLLALGPVLNQAGPLRGQYAGSLWLAGGLSVVILVLRAGLLRRRETAADLYAVAVLGNPGALRHALGREPADDAARDAERQTGTAARPRSLGVARIRQAAVSARRLFATHPTTADRAADDAGRSREWEGGFAVTAAAGMVAMFTGQSIYYAASDAAGFQWSNAQVPSDIVNAVAALIWAAVVLPAWIRRARSAREVESARAAESALSWSRPLAGSVAGLTVGFLLQVPGALSVGRTEYAGHVPLLAACLLIVTTAASLLAICLATRVARPRSQPTPTPPPTPPPIPPAALVGAVLAAWVTLATIMSMMLLLLTGAVRNGGEAVVRLGIIDPSYDRAWIYAPPILVIGLVLVIREPRRQAEGTGDTPVVGRRAKVRRALARIPIPSEFLSIAAVGVVIATIAATLSWMVRIHPDLSLDRIDILVDDRSWICAGSGWAVAGVIVLTGRRTRRARIGRQGLHRADVPTALTAGLITAAVAGIAQFTAIAEFGYGRHWPAFLLFLQTPPSLMFATMPAVLPVLVLIGRFRRPAAARPVVAALTTALTTGVLATALVGGVFAPVTGEPNDHSGIVAAGAEIKPFPVTPDLVPPTPPAPLTTAPLGVDPGRPMDRAGAQAVITAMSALLPPNAAETANDPDGDLSGAQPASCRERLQQVETIESPDNPSKITDIEETYILPAKGTSAGIIVVLDATSYSDSTSEFPALLDQDTACGAFTLPSAVTDDGLIHLALSEGQPPQLPFPTYRENVKSVVYRNSDSFVTTALTDYLQVGHNEVYVTALYGYSDGLLPSSNTTGYPAQLTVAALTTAIQELQEIAMGSTAS